MRPFHPSPANASSKPRGREVAGVFFFNGHTPLAVTWWTGLAQDMIRHLSNAV
jgi:hypothetical protein